MVAKIGRGATINGILRYNLSKVENGKGAVMLLNNIADSPDGKYNLQQLRQSFEPYLAANRRTEKPILHISINPDPRDKVDDALFQKIAQEYMHAMGYGDQPFAVFKHTDVDRTHIHIVSTCVDEKGHKISDTYEHRRSMDVCRDLERKFGLRQSSKKQDMECFPVLHPVEYKKGDIKSQISAVVRYLPQYYQFQSLGAYNALLSLFNITSEEVKGELHGRQRAGLVYFALDDHGQKCSNPFKAALFGKRAGYAKLQDHFAACKETMKNSPAKIPLKKLIEAAITKSKDEKTFRNTLKKSNIDVVARKNQEGRIYGITFIDHESRSVWNGSQLGKELSANIFNLWWNNGIKPLQKNMDRGNAEQQMTLDRMPGGTGTAFLEGMESVGDFFSSFFGILSDDTPQLPEDNQPFIRRRKKRKRRKYSSKEN